VGAWSYGDSSCSWPLEIVSVYIGVYLMDIWMDGLYINLKL